MEFLLIIILLITVHIILLYNSIANQKNVISMHFSQINDYEQIKEDLIYTLIKKIDKKTKDISKIEELLKKFRTMKKINEKTIALIEINELYKKASIKIDDKKYKDDKKHILDIELLIEEKEMYYNEAVLKYNQLLNIFPASLMIRLFKIEKYTFIEN